MQLICVVIITKENEYQKENRSSSFGICSMLLGDNSYTSFLDFPNKAIIITTLLITNEVLFIITIALLGKEYWNKIKNGVSRFFLFRKKETNDQH